jgi:fructokinase
VTVTLDDDGQPGYVVHRPAAYDFPAIPKMELALLLHQKPEYIYFGTLQQMSSTARELTSQLLDAIPQATRFYDLNLRTGCYTPELVRDLMTRAQIVKLNEQEVAEIQGMFQELRGTVEAFCHASLKQFRWHAVCVTQGAKGCTLCTAEEHVQSPGYSVKVADTVGAGDAFAAALLHGFALGMPAGAIADFANRVGALVASRSGAIPQWTIEEALRLSR